MRVIVLDQSRWKWGIACMLALTAVFNVADGAKRVRFASPVVQDVETEEVPGRNAKQTASVGVQTLPWSLSLQGAPLNITLPNPTDQEAALQTSPPAWTTPPPVQTASNLPSLSTSNGISLPGPSGAPTLPYYTHPTVSNTARMSMGSPFPLYAASGMPPMNPGQPYFSTPADMLQSVSTTAPMLTAPGVNIVHGGRPAPFPIYTPVVPLVGGPTFVRPRSANPSNDMMERLKRDEEIRQKGYPAAVETPKLRGILTKGLALVGAFVTAKKGLQGAAGLYKLAKGMSGE